MQTKQSIENSFTYHQPQGDQAERYQSLREEAKTAAMLIHQSCPPSRERSLALTKLEEAIMWANKSIACNEAFDKDGNVYVPCQESK